MIQIVAKIDTKSKFFGAGWNGGLNRFRNIVKEIMLQLFAGAKEEVRTEMRMVEDFVHIASCARHLFGKPCHAAPLPFQFLFNKMAKWMSVMLSFLVFHAVRLPMTAIII